MALVAALSCGVFCYLAAGVVLQRLPAIRRWSGGRVGGLRADDRRVWLAQAGLRLSPAQFAMCSVGAGLLGLLAVWTVTRTWLVALVPAAALTISPRLYYGRRRAERLRSVQAAWPDGLRELVSCIASGQSLTQALEALAANGPPPLRMAFARFPLLAHLLGTRVALEVIKEELADPTSDRVIEVLVLAHERGGRIVQMILEDLIVATTRDLKVREEVETEGLEARINARAVLVLPWLVLVALTIREGSFRTFYRSSAGVVVVLLGLALSSLGYLWISRLGRAQDEARVFDAADAEFAARVPAA
jgi:tight adherence protein B